MFLLIILDREEQWEREEKKNSSVASCTRLTWDGTSHLGMCADHESNLFGVGTMFQSNVSHGQDQNSAS